jgi:hypothetical protein
MTEPVKVSGGLRTTAEAGEAASNRVLFEANPSS